MSIIAISRGSYRRGKEVAEKVAEKLGYTCIDRDLLIDDMKEFHLPEIKMVRNILDATSVLDRFSHGKERYIGSIKAAILKHCQKNNIVYHGLAGHFFVRDVSHAFKIRVISDLEARVTEEMERENISAQDARYILKKDDEERRKWALYLYGIDIKDSTLYDMVINIISITVDDAVDIIANAVKLPCFQPTPESQRKIDDLALGAAARVALFEYPNATVSAVAGKVCIGLKAPVDQKETITANIERVLKDIEAVTDVEVHLEPYF
jgi:cytidylate kinase